MAWTLGLALGLGFVASCRVQPIRTAVVVKLQSDGAMDCVQVTATAEDGRSESLRLPTPQLLDGFAAERPEVAIYPGSILSGTLTLQAIGLRGGKAECQGQAVGESETLETAFEKGKLVRVGLSIPLAGIDQDGDGWEIGVDCDDGRSALHPGAAEICGDGLDQGCLGAPDLGCPCDPEGLTRSCYPLGLDHPSLNTSAGICQVGVQRCVSGAWADCDGAVLPAAESCDGIDTDCDGRLDPPECPCTQGQSQPCFTFEPAEAAGVGSCSFGIATCQGGIWGTCFGDVAPSPEICNGRDDDCNKVIDDPDQIPREFCELRQGLCGLARKACGGSGSVSCTAADYDQASAGRYELDETLCDGLDNDCDGLIDESCDCDPALDPPRPCFPFGEGLADSALQEGACIEGLQTCLSSTHKWGACEGSIVPNPERCDGVDDDCNASVDDVAWAGQACNANAVGLCAQGRLICQPGFGSNGKNCQAATPLDPDPACDGLDADCDSLASPANDDRDASCPGTGLCCAAACRDIDTDPEHCGDCFAPCVDDGNPCTDPACASGVCTFDNHPEGEPCPDDGSTCTTDACSAGQCLHQALPDGSGCADSGGSICIAGACVARCWIAGAAYNDGDGNPSNDCEVCDSVADPFGWSPRSSTVSCASDGNPCTNDHCDAGSASCGHFTRSAGVSCGSGLICIGSSCQASCYISGQAYAALDSNPSNPCERCLPSQSTTSFSPSPASTLCNDGSFCTIADHCDGAGACTSGGPQDCSALTTGCLVGSCNETSDQCDAIGRAVGGACTTSGSMPGVCDGAGVCVNSCYISGSLQGAGSHPGANVCRSCVPASSTSAWTNESSATLCNDGAFCTDSDHCNGTGSCVGGGAHDCSSKTTACAVASCDDVQDQCVPNPVAGGTGCTGGKICDGAGSCSNGCFIAGVFYAAAAPNPSAECQQCDPVSSTSNWSNLGVVACTPDTNACTKDQCGGGVCTHAPNDGSSCGAGCSCVGSVASEVNCSDSVDNDGDSLTDCADLECDGNSCDIGGKICASGVCN